MKTQNFSYEKIPEKNLKTPKQLLIIKNKIKAENFFNLKR